MREQRGSRIAGNDEWTATRTPRGRRLDFRLARFACVAAAACMLLPDVARSAEAAGHGHIPHHHVAVIAGGGLETEDGHSDRAGFALGVAYEYRFHEKWGIGAAADALAQNTSRDAAIAVPVSYHPSESWRLFAGPGVEFSDHGNEALLRLGVGYEIRLSDRWTLAPEFVADFVSGGKKLFIGGLALGYEF